MPIFSTTLLGLVLISFLAPGPAAPASPAANATVAPSADPSPGAGAVSAATPLASPTPGSSPSPTMSPSQSPTMSPSPVGGGRFEPAMLSLSALESRIDVGPALQAAKLQVLAATELARSLNSKNGYSYDLSNGFGPRSDIIRDGINNNTVRYSQGFGVEIPMLGTKLRNQADTVNAQEDVLYDDIAVAKQRNLELTQLRTAFVQYWTDVTESALASHYLHEQNQLLSAARALRHEGFWTLGNFADYLDIVARTRREVASFDADGRAAFAAMESVVGGKITTVPPDKPDLRLICALDHDALTASAMNADADSLRYQAQIGAVDELVPLVKHSSIDARAGVSVDADIDIPRGEGYDVTAGLALTIPQHMRIEEEAHREELLAERASSGALLAQRRAEVEAGLDKALADYRAAIDAEQSALQDATARLEDEREVKVQTRELQIAPAVAFADIQTRMAETYAARRAVVTTAAAVLEAGNAVVTLAPTVCRGR